MAFSLFDHPYFSALLRHEEIAALFTANAETATMLRFEAALAAVEADLGIIPKEAGAAIVSAIDTFQLNLDDLVVGASRDGLVVPTLIRNLRQAVAEKHRAHVHLGATSQDVIDTSLILRIKDALAIFRHDLSAIEQHLDQLSSQYGTIEIMGRTRMQRALPIMFTDRVATWTSPLVRQLQALDALEANILAVQFGGAVGTFDALGEQGAAVRVALAKDLGLVDPGRPWHAERDRLADLANWLTKISGSLGKIGQDLVLMGQNEVGEALMASGGLSSAMPHKRNPIQAEILIALARFNAGQLASMHQAMIHEGERSGAAWTLEWLILPAMIGTTAASLKLGQACLEGLTIRSTL